MWVSGAESKADGSTSLHLVSGDSSGNIVYWDVTNDKIVSTMQDGNKSVLGQYRLIAFFILTVGLSFYRQNTCTVMLLGLLFSWNLFCDFSDFFFNRVSLFLIIKSVLQNEYKELASLKVGSVLWLRLDAHLSWQWL